MVVGRSVGDIEARTFATVVATDGRGSRLVGPDYPSPAFGSALHMERAAGSSAVTATGRSLRYLGVPAVIACW